MKTVNITEYAIYKLFDDSEPCYWDGPFATKMEAQKFFDQRYLNKAGQQDFVLCKFLVRGIAVKRSKRSNSQKARHG